MRHRKYLFLFAALVLASTFIGFLWFWAKSPIDCARLKGEQAERLLPKHSQSFRQ